MYCLHLCESIKLMLAYQKINVPSASNVSLLRRKRVRSGGQVEMAILGVECLGWLFRVIPEM